MCKASGLTGLFTGQYNTEDYGTFTGVVYSFGRSTSCSSNIIFIMAPNLFHSCWSPFYCDQTNVIFMLIKYYKIYENSQTS